MENKEQAEIEDVVSDEEENQKKEANAVNNEQAENEKMETEQEEMQQDELTEAEANTIEEEIAKKDQYIQQLESELEEAKNRLLRAQADFENFRRRSKLEFEAAQKYRAQSLIEDLLPVLDNFERALAIGDDADEKLVSFIKGMEMVQRQLLDALHKEGLEIIEAKGQEFDPHVHQAVMQVEDSEYDSNVVVEELQKGYMLKDRVIRPSMVKVNQ